MKKNSYILALACTACLLPLLAHAELTLPKEHIGTARKCTPVRSGDTRLKVTPFMLANVSQENVQVACGLDVDAGNNGTVSFGGVITNLQANQRTVNCVGYMNSGGNGIYSFPRSVIVGPYKNPRITWTAADVGLVKFGGQVEFWCTLPPGTAVQWVFMTTTHGS